jgi:DNA-binding response OmpR family regulator
MKKKVLLLDDKTVFRRLFRIFLNDDYNVESAENGLEALSMMSKGYKPDVIVSDIMMPEMDGIQFLKQLKSSGHLKDIPVIMLSSIDKSLEKVKVLNLGATDYLEKPFNPSELKARIEIQINNKRV